MRRGAGSPGESRGMSGGGESLTHGLLKDLGIEQGSKHFKNPKVIQPKVRSNFLLRGGYTFLLFF